MGDVDQIQEYIQRHFSTSEETKTSMARKIWEVLEKNYRKRAIWCLNGLNEKEKKLLEKTTVLEKSSENQHLCGNQNITKNHLVQLQKDKLKEKEVPFSETVPGTQEKMKNDTFTLREHMPETHEKPKKKKVVPETQEKLKEKKVVPETQEKLKKKKIVPETQEKLKRKKVVPETQEKLTKMTDVPEIQIRMQKAKRQLFPDQ